MSFLLGYIVGVLAWFLFRYLVAGLYTVNQNERAVKTSFGRAQRAPGNATTADDPISEGLGPEELTRYNYPQVRVIMPGGPYFKWPWEKVYKVSVATQTINMAHDPENPDANRAGTILEAVTKDQLNTGLTGQIRYRVSERNLYAYMFGVKNPIAHVMGYFVSVLRERIANFEAPQIGPADDSAAPESPVHGISINDLRKNLRDLNDHTIYECRTSAAWLDSASAQRGHRRAGPRCSGDCGQSETAAPGWCRTSSSPGRRARTGGRATRCRPGSAGCRR